MLAYIDSIFESRGPICTVDTSCSEMHSKAFPYTFIHGSLKTEKFREYEKNYVQALKIPHFFGKR